MSIKDFVKPIVFGSNRYYLGKELHKKQLFIYIGFYTLIFGIAFILFNYNYIVILIWVLTVSSLVLRYYSTDWVGDAISFKIGSKVLGESKISSNPEVHQAIKELEKNSNIANKEKVKKLKGR